MKTHRRPMTLIEVLIAVGLSTVLLMTLMNYYHFIETLSQKAARVKEELFQGSFAKFRMNEALGRVFKSSNKEFVFYVSEGPSLVFTFDRGVDLDPAFSNHALARLYIDEKQQLSLAQWPLPIVKEVEDISAMKKEVLLDNVESLSFDFYYPPDIDKGPVSETQPVKTGQEKPIPSVGWSQDWLRDYQALPTLIRITIARDGKSHVYTFSLYNADRNLIQYRR